MLGKLAVCTALLLLMASVLPAAIFQSQDFGIGSQNAAAVLGQGAASSTEVITLGQLQQTTDKSGLYRAVQGEIGALAQGAGVGGVAGLLAVEQSGVVNGFQEQVHPGTAKSLGSQIQGFGVGLDQQIKNLGGLGLALGLQAVVGVQVQLIATPFGVNVNVQPVAVSVFDYAAQ